MGPSGGFPKDSAGARGEGLEPSITGPEPVVLPITPPPNGWMIRLAEPVGVVSAPGAGANSGRTDPSGTGRKDLARRPSRSGVVQPFQVVVAEDAPQAHPHGFL